VTAPLQNQTIHRTVLDNGIVVLVAENPAADIIAARILYEPVGCWQPQQAGLAHLLAAVLTKGTSELSFRNCRAGGICRASLSTDAAADYFAKSEDSNVRFCRNFRVGRKTIAIADVSKVEVELERRLALQNIRSQQEQPTIAFEQLRQAMYQTIPMPLQDWDTKQRWRLWIVLTSSGIISIFPSG